MGREYGVKKDIKFFHTSATSQHCPRTRSILLSMPVMACHVAMAVKPGLITLLPDQKKDSLPMENSTSVCLYLHSGYS